MMVNEGAFCLTPIGAALRRYEIALGAAWVVDGADGVSDVQRGAAWEAAYAARDILVGLLQPRTAGAELPAAAHKCRVCGCTDDRACDGGCHWVERDLCSSCRDKEKGNVG